MGLKMSSFPRFGNFSTWCAVLLMITAEFMIITAAKTKDEVQDARIEKLETKLQNIEAKLNAAGTSLLFGIGQRKSCKEIRARDKSAVSGIYSIQPIFSIEPFEVYCDMETQGGGWTLVYSYTFTNYDHFSSWSNAVTPRPNWPVKDAQVPISTTPPLSELSLGAVNFSLWKEIGQEILIKSNINDWIVCQPNGGNLLTLESGPISCQNIKNVAPACTDIAPDYMFWWSYYGPVLSFKSYAYYFFDGSTITKPAGTFPAHDPCGRDGINQNKGVINPGGQIYVR